MQLNMAVKKKKVEDIEVQGAEIEKPQIVKAKPKHKTELYTLIRDVEISGKLVKKGTKYPLTEQGAKYFKSKFYIK
jgi:hypothetical protein